MINILYNYKYKFLPLYFSILLFHAIQFKIYLINIKNQFLILTWLNYRLKFDTVFKLLNKLFKKFNKFL